MNFINPDAIINLWANNRQQQLQEPQIKNVLTEQPQIVQSKTPEPENEILKYQGQNAPHVKDSFSTNFLKKQVSKKVFCFRPIHCSTFDSLPGNLHFAESCLISMCFNSVNEEEFILFRMDQQKNLAGVRNLEEYPRSYNKTFVKKKCCTINSIGDTMIQLHGKINISMTPN